MGSGSVSPSEGAKRREFQIPGRPESARKRVKMRDLESVFRCEDISNQNVKSSDKIKLHQSSRDRDRQYLHTVDSNGVMGSVAAATSENIMVQDGTGRLSSAQKAANAVLALRSGVTGSSYDAGVDKLTCSKRDEGVGLNVTKPLGLGLDLNIDASNLEQPSLLLFSHKSMSYMKAKESSESGSCPVPRDENESESLRIWRDMKKNGFLSSSHGGMPTLPKVQGHPKKRKAHSFKSKIELAKKEQMNRFSEVAAPSGLLSGLNPGIINHVRNSKQVFSIIEALANSKKQTVGNSGRQANEDREENKAADGVRDRVDIELKRGHSRMENPISMWDKYPNLNSECKIHASNAKMPHCTSAFSAQHMSHQEQRLNLKLASENLNCFSSADIPSSQESVSSLSVKAATVASQWLELLQQDLIGRLAALKRSRHRFRDLTQRELPFLFPNVAYHWKDGDICSGSIQMSSAAHTEKWKPIFYKLEKVLSEEENHLNISLKQVKEMQEHCDGGLRFVNLLHGFQQLGMNKEFRKNHTEGFEKECAVQAAAASIYSSCNWVLR